MVITFSRKPLRQINAEKEQQKVDNTQWSKINYDQKTKPLTSCKKESYIFKDFSLKFRLEESRDNDYYC